MVMGLAACGGGETTATPGPSPSVSLPAAGTNDGPDGREDLAALAALAEDKSFAALYTFDDSDGRQRNVVATVGADHTWRVDVGGGALGGTADVSIVSVAAGVYQCPVASATNPVTPTCVKLAAAGKPVPAQYDPQVERLFRQWLPVFTDPQSALSVTEVAPLDGAQGTCFSVDSIAAALAAPVDIGIYCYTRDGMLTAARVDFGRLTLTSLAAGPATVPLPGPEVPGQPMGLDSPPPGLQPSDSQPAGPQPSGSETPGQAG
jgi:hypothetical protein